MIDPTDPIQVELVAAIAYSFTFHARQADADWERTKLRAEQGAGYAGAIVERCYAEARAILAALAKTTDWQARVAV